MPEAMADRAAELGYPAFALADRDGVYGAPRFHKAATRVRAEDLDHRSKRRVRCKNIRYRFWWYLDWR